MRLLYRGNKILRDLFSTGAQSIRQFSKHDADAKGCYRFLYNDRVSEEDIISNLSANCKAACAGKWVLSIQDSSEANLSSHARRLRKDDSIGTTNANGTKGLGFFIHPSLILDAQTGIPYGYADIKIWNRPLAFHSKFERQYSQLPIEEKESYKWIEASKKTKEALADTVQGILIIQDREGDIYEQFAVIPDEKTNLLIRAKTNRTLGDKTKLFSCFDDQPAQGKYQLRVAAGGKKKREKRLATLEVRYKEVELKKTAGCSPGVPSSLKLYIIEAKEVGYNGTDCICWRLLTTMQVTSLNMAMVCIGWYSWRWMIEEVFKILKKEGYDIEASELESASAIRKLCLMMLEVIIKLFLMRIAYAEPETPIEAAACFTEDEQAFLEQQSVSLEGKTAKQKNPHSTKDLKRYVWVIARLGGWKGYESKRTPGITTLWIGLKYFKAAKQGWDIHRNVSTR